MELINDCENHPPVLEGADFKSFESLKLNEIKLVNIEPTVITLKPFDSIINETIKNDFLNDKVVNYKENKSNQDLSDSTKRRIQPTFISE